MFLPNKPVYQQIKLCRKYCRNYAKQQYRPNKKTRTLASSAKKKATKNNNGRELN